MKGYTVIIMAFLVFSCSQEEKSLSKVAEEKIAVENLLGHWENIYNNGLGYEFTFKKEGRDTKGEITIHLHDESLKFFGEVLFSQNQLLMTVLKISRKSSAGKEWTRPYSVTQSKFIFNVKKHDKSSDKGLRMEPLTVLIEGRDTIGYFEPYFILHRNG
jgi:hypothetical protein